MDSGCTPGPTEHRRSPKRVPASGLGIVFLENALENTASLILQGSIATGIREEFTVTVVAETEFP